MSRASQYVAGQFALFAIIAMSLFLFPRGDNTLLRLVGVLLVVGGVAVLALAVYAYQRANATLPHVEPTPDAKAELVTSGIYARVRHPIYTAVLLGGMGVALAHGHIAVIVLALLLIPFFTFKSRYEETLLRRAYPEYANYMTRTGRFLPFL